LPDEQTEIFLKIFLTRVMKSVTRYLILKGRIKLAKIFGVKIGNWWCWEKKEVGVCPVPQ